MDIMEVCERESDRAIDEREGESYRATGELLLGTKSRVRVII